MMPKNEQSNERIEKIKSPTVEIHIPKITLRLDDVAYLRSMDNDDKIKCAIPENKKQRLRILRLIETRQVPPTKEKLALIEKEETELRKELKEAAEQDKFDKLSNLGYLLQNLQARKKPSPLDVITEQGRQLLETGTVTVQLKKTGCL